MAIEVDITNSSEVNNMVKEALRKFGKIDILINNAGIITSFKPFIEQSEADWDKLLNVNLKGGMICTKAVLPHMIGRKSGKIINISSAGAKKCSPNGEVYCATKAGVIAFTKSLAVDVIELGINVNCIAPGASNTNLGVECASPEFLKNILEGILTETPARRATTPQDVANMVAYLVSDVASDIVGQTFSVDGGLTMTA
jgi:NAD(P)-dependent dehydrogenase (short-subunit alcohol dehydrogenase family)